MATGYDNEDVDWGTFNPDANAGTETAEEKKRREEAEKAAAQPQANYATREDVTLANGQPFNYGSPGSATEKINRQNPTAALDKPYVQEGDTGGYLVGTGVTVGEGRSVTPAEAAAQKAQFLASGYSEAEWNDFMARNPLDSNRALEAQTNGGENKSGGSGWSSQALGSQQSGLLNDLYTRLRGRMDQSLNVSASDPNIRTQANPYRASVERQRRDYLSGLAERGSPTQNLNAEGRMASEKAGQAVGAYEGDLVGVEVAARRQEIADALDTYAGLLNSEEERSLRMELAQLDAELRRQAMSQNQSQFDSTLGFNAEDRAAYYDLVRRGLL